MANLYSLRAGAIEMARRDTVTVIGAATSAFDDPRTHDGARVLPDRWLVDLRRVR